MDCSEFGMEGLDPLNTIRCKCCPIGTVLNSVLKESFIYGVLSGSAVSKIIYRYNGPTSTARATLHQELRRKEKNYSENYEEENNSFANSFRRIQNSSLYLKEELNYFLLMDTPANSAVWNLEDELKKNRNLNRGDVENLRYFCEALPLSNVTDEVITAILHSNEYDLEQARSAATKYFELRANSPEVFGSRQVDGDELRSAFDVLYFCPLPRRSAEGYRIILQKIRRSEVQVFDQAAASKLQFLTMDSLIHEDPTCPGYIFVGDMRGMSMGHIFKASFFLTRKLLRYMQEGIPINIHHVFIINAGTISDKMLRLVKPFVKRSMWDIIKFYSANQMEEFWDAVPKTFMPRDYGGDLPDFETLREEQIHWLRRLQPILDIRNSRAQ